VKLAFDLETEIWTYKTFTSLAGSSSRHQTWKKF